MEASQKLEQNFKMAVNSKRFWEQNMKLQLLNSNED